MSGAEHGISSMYILESRTTLCLDSFRLEVRKRPILGRVSQVKRVAMSLLLTSSLTCSWVVSILMEMLFVMTCLHGECIVHCVSRGVYTFDDVTPEVGFDFCIP